MIEVELIRTGEGPKIAFSVPGRWHPLLASPREAEDVARRIWEALDSFDAARSVHSPTARGAGLPSRNLSGNERPSRDDGRQNGGGSGEGRAAADGGTKKPAQPATAEGKMAGVPGKAAQRPTAERKNK